MSQEIKICSDASGCFIGGLSAADTIASDTKIKAPCFVKDGGSSSQFLKADGSSDSNSYTTCLGDVTGIDAGTAITISDGSTATPQVAVTSACNTAWNSAKSLADGLTTCAGLACVGTVTGLTAGNAGIDVGTGTTPAVCLDLSELADGTAAIVPTSDEVVYLDAGSQKRKLFSEIFGSNAYNSTTIPTNTNQLTNGAGFTTCTGTVVAGDISSFTSCQGDVTGIDAGTAITVTDGSTATPQVAVTSACNTAWNSAKSIADGLATCAGLACTGDITGVTAGLLLSGGGNSGSVTLG